MQTSILPDTRRSPCPHHATRPTSPTKSGSSSNRCLAQPKSAADRQSGRCGRWRTLSSTFCARVALGACSPRVPAERQTVYYHFRRWRLDGRLRRAHDRLREKVREAEGRDRDPSVAVIDSQVVKTTSVGGPERGYDGAKRLAGRKRHILVDTNGLALAAKVHGANLPDRDGGRRLLGEGQGLPRMELLWADGAYTGGFRRWLRRRLGWRLEVPHHPDRQLWRYGLEEKPRGFRVLPRRWVVERTFAWLGMSRRLSKDYERLPQTGVAMIYAAMSRIMLRRLARTT